MTRMEVHERIVVNSPCLCVIDDRTSSVWNCSGIDPVTLMGLFVAAWNQYRRGDSALGG